MTESDTHPSGPMATTGPMQTRDVAHRIIEARVRAVLFDETLQPTTLGRYRVIEPLGQGGFGTVYVAHDDELDRRLAVKVLRIAADDDARRDRVLTEARALAKLSHPNVVEVYDVTTERRSSGDVDVVIAMELVVGQTLSAWVRERSPAIETIVGAFVQAGRGLSAAHDAGLVHGDFKPDNVMRGEDGRIRVLDFGLSRPWQSSEQPGTGPSFDDLAQTYDAGRIAGTPTYMAPEQHTGHEIDARADQYSFCVALWEALLGARPFLGTTLRELRAAKLVGPPTITGALPTPLRRVLLRGLSVTPADRYPSMDALLADLEPRRSGSFVPVVAGVLVVAALAAGLVWLTPSSDACDVGEDRVAAVWSPARRAAVRHAFDRSAIDYARATFDTVAPRLDRWSRSWAAAHRTACLDGPQAPTRLDETMGCLERALQRASATVDVLALADAETIQHALESVDALPDPTECTGPSFATVATPPSDADRVAIEQVRDEVAQAMAQTEAGHFSAGLRHAEAAVARADALDRPLLRAESAYARGRVLAELRRTKEAIADLESAANVAETIGDDRLLAQAATELVDAYGGLGDLATAKRWEGRGLASMERVGDPPRLRREMHAAMAGTLLTVGNYEAAIARYEEGLALVTKHFDGDPRLAYPFTHNIANAHYFLGDLSAAIEGFRTAVRLGTETMGARHPKTLVSRSNLVGALRNAERLDEALAEGEAVVRDYELQPDLDPGPALVNLANVLDSMGRTREAAEHLQRSVEATERASGPDALLLVQPLVNLARMRSRMLQHDRARALARRALDIQTEHVGPVHISIARTSTVLAEIEQRALQLDDAARHARDAIEVGTQAGMADDYIVGTAHGMLAYAEVSRGRAEQALVAAEEASRIVQAAVGPEHFENGIIALARADALAQLGRSEAARAAITDARTIFDATPADTTALAAYATLIEVMLTSDDDGARKRLRAVFGDLEPALAQRASPLLAER